MDRIVRDFRYSFRALRQSPGFAISAVLALALGIGGNAAIFSVVNTVLWRPLPYQSPDEIVRIIETNTARNVPEMNVAPANFLDFRERSRTLRFIAASRSVSRGLSGAEGPISVSGLSVTQSFFEVLGAKASLGRGFLPEEAERGSTRVVVLSDHGWRKFFGADPAIVGKSISLDGETHTVVGVMPTDTEWPGATDLWLPLTFEPQDAASRTGHNLVVLGRLRPGVTVAQGEADLQSVAASLAEQHPMTNSGWSVRAMAFREQIVRDVRPALLLLMGAVSFVLLIACSNVANLFLVRAAGRQREMAIRIAMGAGRGRIVGQLLTESLLLSGAGAMCGLLLAVSTIKMIAAARPNLLPRMQEFSVDASLLLFTAALTVLTALLFGLAPAWQLASPDLNAVLRDGGRGSTAGRNRYRLRSALVMSEVGFSLILLVGTGLLVRSLVALHSADTGFHEKNVLTMFASLAKNRYQDDHQIARFYQEVLRRIRALPGVEDAGGVSALPLTAANMMVRFQVEGTAALPVGQRPPARYDTITPGYLETMGIPLKSGRTFTDRDTMDSPPVAIISESLARRYFLNQDPVGKRIGFNFGYSVFRQIIGVVGDVKHQSLDEGPRVTIYEPAAQAPFEFLWVVVRGERVGSLAAAIRREFSAVDKDLPVDRIRMMDDVIAESVFQRRFTGFLVGGFAVLALLLAAVGIYGVIAYSVAQRRTEIGIRLALGAQHQDVLWMVLRQGLVLALSGAVVGLAFALVIMRLLGTMLYGVQPADPLTYAAAVAALLAIAFIACYVPARRVTRVNPVVALRDQ